MSSLAIPDTLKSSKTRQEQPSAHRMTTRSRVKSFQFMQLPPELRYLIYQNVFVASQPQDFNNFELPNLLSVSHTLREEALPVFFATSTFTTTLRSNWCVRNSHWHSAGYLHHFDTGTLDISPLLQTESLAVRLQVVRFHKIDFNVTCACCVGAIEIGTVQLRVIQRMPSVVVTGTSINSFTKSACATIGEEVKRKVATIMLREHFNGFSTADLRAIATCFRHSPANARAATVL